MTDGIGLPLGVELDDGTPLRLRLGTTDDRDALAAGFGRLSPESRIARFFTGMPRLSSLFLDRLLDLDESRHVAIVAEDMSRMSDVDDQTKGLGIGVARYITSNTDATQAEMAIAVIDEYHGRGIGHLLLDALVDHAVRNGVTTGTATVLSDNSKMLRLLTSMGATPRQDPDDRTVMTVEIPLGADHGRRSLLHTMLSLVATGDDSSSREPDGVGEGTAESRPVD
jgi:GNAT superfamily N-acetyltransferase